MKEESYDYLVKILMVGESGVGKTCIIQRFTKNEFFTNNLSTIAVDFKMKMLKINNKKLKMQIWDTAGQERFKSLTSGFFKGSDGIVLTFSLIDKNSFDNINKWMIQVKALAPQDVRIVLVGNKADCEERVILYEEAKALADKFNIKYFETSAKTGTNIEDMFQEMGNQVIDKLIKNPPQLVSYTTYYGNGNQTENKKKCCN